MSLMGSWCFVFVGNVEKVSKCSISTLFRTFLCHDTFFPQTHFTCCIHISKQLNIQAREPLSRQGKPCFLISEMPKGCPSINKLYQLSDILAYPITVHRDVQKSRNTFFCFENMYFISFWTPQRGKGMRLLLLVPI